MHTKPFFVLFTFLCTAALLTAADLQVISTTPQGENTPLGRQPVSITFNQPVTALGEKSAFSSENCPLAIIPSVEGKCRFIGTQTLQFEPTQDWTPATRYTVTLPANFASVIDGKSLQETLAWSFVTARPEVEEITPLNNEQFINLRPIIYVVLSQPVDLATAQQAVQLTYRRKDLPLPTRWEQFKALLLHRSVAAVPTHAQVPVRVRALTDTEYKEHYSYQKRNHVFAIEPLQELPPHAQVTLTLSTALRGSLGELGLEKDFSSVFYTYPKLEIVGGTMEGCLPLDAQIAFSSPVRLGDLLAHMQVSSQNALLPVTEEEKQSLGYQQYVPTEKNEQEKGSSLITLPPATGYFVMPLSFLRQTPDQTITLTIDKDLTDIYGQKLGTTQYVTVRNSGYCPAVEFKDGTGVLESTLPARHPIDVMNVAQLPVQAARFNRSNFIPFFLKDTKYCQPKEIAQVNLQYKGEYPFDITPNQTKRTYLDLSKFNPSARQSIIFSQVRIPSKYRPEGYCWQGATDNITDLGVTLKTSRDNILVWVTSLQEGTPKEGAEVQLRGSDNRILWTGRTDKHGVALAPGTQELNAPRESKWEKPQIFAFVTSSNGDAVLSSSWDDGLEPWRFNINFDYNPEPTQWMTALFTDRGVYRPGETVYIKGLTRKQKQGVWVLPQLTQATLQIRNSRWEKVKEETVHYDTHGGFELRFTLPEDAATGTWQLQFFPQADTQETNYSFRVEAVKQADFAVHLRALKNAYTSGEHAEFTASADYLFGSPVAGGKAKWSVRRNNDWFRPTGYEEYEFIPYFLEQDDTDTQGLLQEASAELDAQGQLKFSVKMPKVTRRQNLSVEVGVQSPTGQQLFARSQVALNPADFYLGAYMQRWAVELGENASARVVALDINGKPIGPVQVQARIKKEEYFSVRKSGLSGRLEWVSQRRSKDMGSQTFTVPATGTDFSFLPKESGRYQVIFSAQDAQGRQVKGGFSMMVYGQGQAYWKQNDDDILTLQQEKNLYNPGETARLLVQSPYEQATALITVERGGVLEHWVKTISSGADYIDVPIKNNYAPNVFVGVTLVRGRAEKASYDKDGLDLAKPQGKTGYAQLNISQRDKEINTTVSADKAQYLPGEEVTVKLTTAVNGRAIPSELTVMAVDEGILALTGYQVPNLMKIFYAPQALSVSTADNRVFLIGQRNFGEKGENRGGGGGLLSQLGGTDLRSHFEFTPYFQTRIQTDAQGKGEVKFTLPDNLTTFRIMAVASTVQEFGAGETAVKVSKPLMIVPKMPRFARQGDKLQCGAVIYNYEEDEGRIDVSAHATGGLQLTEQKKTLQVLKGAAAEVSWPCKAVQIGEAEVQFSAVAKANQDSVVVKLPVQEVERKQTLALYDATEGTQAQVLEQPSSVNEEEINQVTLSLAATALLKLRGGMLYLLTYPYDCLEQKMSKILPVIEGKQLIKDFNLGDVEQYHTTVQKILRKIPAYQTSSGGLSYWPDNTYPDGYVTAYTLEVAYRAAQAGYAVPSDSLQKATVWLKKIFTGEELQAYPYSEEENRTLRAYALYVLALYGEKLETQFNTLYTQRNALSVPAQAYLLLAAQALQRPEPVQTQLKQSLLNQAQYGSQTMHFSAGESKQPWLHADEVKVTALVLETLLKTKAPLAQSYQVVNWLTQQLNARGHWKNTADNAAVFSALHTYYTLKETQEPDFTVKVTLEGEPIWSEHFAGRSLNMQEKAFSFDQVYALSGQSRIELAKSGTGTLYYTLAQIYTPLNYTGDLNSGFEVSRQITDLKGNAVAEFKAGKRYKVTLKTRTATDYSFVALEDFLPAGFEIVHTDLATESQQEDTLQDSFWGGFEREEKYDDRIAVFADFLPAGDHTYSYLVQATVEGEFNYPSLWASQMYDPGVFGRNATSRVVVRP